MYLTLLPEFGGSSVDASDLQDWAQVSILRRPLSQTMRAMGTRLNRIVFGPW